MWAPDVTAVLFRLTPMAPDSQLCLGEEYCGSGGVPRGSGSNAEREVTVKLNIESVPLVSEDKLSLIYTARLEYYRHILSMPGACSGVTLWGGSCMFLLLIGYEQLMDSCPSGYSDPEPSNSWLLSL